MTTETSTTAQIEISLPALFDAMCENVDDNSIEYLRGVSDEAMREAILTVAKNYEVEIEFSGRFEDYRHQGSAEFTLKNKIDPFVKGPRGEWGIDSDLYRALQIQEDEYGGFQRALQDIWTMI